MVFYHSTSFFCRVQSYSITQYSMSNPQLRRLLLESKKKAQLHQYNSLTINENQGYSAQKRPYSEIVISKYANVFVKNLPYNQNVKYPLPVAYAFLQQLFNSQQYKSALKCLNNQFDKNHVSNSYIISYNKTRIYHKLQDPKRAMFLIQELLKEKTAFLPAIYDYCRMMIQESDRQEQAADFLKRYLKNGNGNQAIQSLYLKAVVGKNCPLNDVLKNFSHRKLSLSVYYNIGVYLRTRKEYVRAQEVFTSIIAELAKIVEKEEKNGINSSALKKQRISNNSNACNASDTSNEPDTIQPGQIMLEKARLNLAKVYEAMYAAMEDKQLARIYLRKCQQIYKLFEKKYPKVVERSPALKHKLQWISENYKFEAQDLFIENQVKHGASTSKPNSPRNTNKSVNKKEKGSEFDKDFKAKRAKNEQKLKYLLWKQKQLKQFFSQVVVSESPNKSLILQKKTDPVYAKLIASAQKELKSSQFYHFEEDFNRKLEKQRLKFTTDEELDRILAQIISAIGNDKTLHPHKTKTKAQKEPTPHKLTILQSQRNSHKGHTSQNSQILNSTQTSYPVLQQPGHSSQNSHIGENSQNVLSQRKNLTTNVSRAESPDRQTDISNASKNQSKKNLNTHKKRDSINVCTKFLNFNHKALLPAVKGANNREPRTSRAQKNRMANYKNNAFEIQLQKGQELEKDGRYRQAFKFYVDLYKKYKEDYHKQQILLRIGNNFEVRGQVEEASQTYLKCCKFNNPKAFMSVGSLLIKHGRVKSGIENLEKANCIERFNLDIENKLVYGYSLLEDTHEKALLLATSILRRQPSSLETLIMTANILQKRGKTKQALDIALAIDSHQETEDIKHYIGILYLGDSNVSQAFQWFQSALRIKPNHIPSLIEIATILSDLKPDESLKIFEKVLEIDPKNKMAATRMGKIYESVDKNHSKAIETYMKTLQGEKTYESYLKIGDCLSQQGSYSEALFNYRQSLDLKPTSQVHQKIALMYEKQLQRKKAIEHFNIALDLLPKANSAYSTRKHILFEIARNSLCIQDYDTIISCMLELLQSQESREGYMMLGQAYYGKTDYDEAIFYFQRANSLKEEDDLEILQHIALCFDRKQEYLASKAIYQKILAVNPDNVKSINNLANILLLTGNTNQAFFWFQNMLQKIPNNIDKRLKVIDTYSTVGDWSKVEHHLMICYKQKDTDTRVLEKLTNMYRAKRESKLANKYERKLLMVRSGKNKV